jgi:hypothetical protein
MVAADWYGVYPDTEISARVLRLGPTVDRLEDADVELLASLAGRLADEHPSGPESARQSA